MSKRFYGVCLLVTMLTCLPCGPSLWASGHEDAMKWLWGNSNLTVGLTNTVLTTDDTHPVYQEWGDVLMDGRTFSSYHLLNEDGTRMIANFNVNLSVGNTYYLTKPFANEFLRLGLDVKWASLNFTDFSVYRKGYWGLLTCQYDLGELSIEAGPSLTMRLYERMLLSVYARYAPTAAVFFCQDFVTGSFMNYYNAGVSFSFGTLGLGFERRAGFGEFMENGHGADNVRFHAANEGYRAYLTFRF